MKNTNVNINTRQLKKDLTATHADGTRLSLAETLILLIKHNPGIIISILYSISPIDLIPDVVPVLGSVDDTIVLLIPILKLFKETLDARAQASSAGLSKEDNFTNRQDDGTTGYPDNNAQNQLKDMADQLKNLNAQMNAISAGETENTSGNSMSK